MSDKTRAMHARTDGANIARSICPYCGVGCGQLIYHKDGKLISIEGDPESPISQGNLCPKGAASYQLLTHSRRETKMKYRAPRAKNWSRDFVKRSDGHGRRSGLGIAQAHVRAQKKWRDYQSHNRDLSSRWRHARQRRKLSYPKTLHCSAWGWCAFPTRRGYDIAARCPVWAPPLAGAELRLRNRIWPTPIAF